MLTPYALTGAAVDYYLSRMRARSDSANPFVNYSEGLPHRGSFQYSATVSAAADSNMPVNACSVHYGLRAGSFVTAELKALVPTLSEAVATRCAARAFSDPGAIGEIHLDSVTLAEGNQRAVVHLGITRKGGASFPERHHLRRLFPPPSRLMWGHDSIVIGLVVYR